MLLRSTSGASGAASRGSALGDQPRCVAAGRWPGRWHSFTVLAAKKGGDKKGGDNKKGPKKSALADLMKKKEAAASATGGQPAQPAQYDTPEARMLAFQMCDSYWRLTKKYLFEGVDFNRLPGELYRAPFALLAHNRFQEGVTDPIYIYGNRAALELFETTWDELLQTPSRKSAADDPGAQKVCSPGRAPSSSSLHCTTSAVTLLTTPGAERPARHGGGPVHAAGGRFPCPPAVPESESGSRPSQTPVLRIESPCKSVRRSCNNPYRAHHKDRNGLLDQAAKTGVVSGFEVWRVSKSGRRFKIKDGTLFNIMDREGTKLGQAAVFSRYELEDGREVVITAAPVEEGGSGADGDDGLGGLPSPEQVAAAEAAVAEQAAHVRALKEQQGLTNQDIPVQLAVFELKKRKEALAGLQKRLEEALAASEALFDDEDE